MNIERRNKKENATEKTRREGSIEAKNKFN